jgi:hypothetical protein
MLAAVGFAVPRIEPRMTTAGAGRRSFLGVPVEGDVPLGRPRPVQRPLSDLEPVLRTILADQDIVAFGWTQYTPYYNDGERCEFGVNAPWFRTTVDAENDEDLEDLELSIHPTLAPHRYDHRVPGRFVPVERDAETVARYARCQALADALATGEFDDVLLDAFGDHAHIRISPSGITVDEYEHD